MPATPSKVGYILFVDEAGDDGLEAIKPIDGFGSSEWMVLSGVLIHAKDSDKPVAWIREFRERFKGSQREDLHFAALRNDEQRLQACEHVASKHLRWFAVISNKRNMRQYRNDRAAKHDTRSPFYNWMLRLLLERASAYCAERSMRDYGEMRSMRVELGARGGVSIPRLRVYLFHKLKRQSQAGTLYLKRGDIAWEVMDENQIEIFQAHRRAGIQLADVVASALRMGVDAKADGTTLPMFGEALLPVVARGKRDVISDYGVKLLPEGAAMHAIGLSPAQVSFLKMFGYSRFELVGPDP